MHIKAQRLGGLEIDRQLERRGLLDRQVHRFGTSEYLGAIS
jgi:hypothetical protein